VIGEHLTADARAAHGRMLAAFDRLMAGVLRREEKAIYAKLRHDGRTPAEAAAGALAHVAKLSSAIQTARAVHEAEGVAQRH